MADFVKFKEDKEPQRRKKRSRINFKAILLIFLAIFFISSMISSIIYSLSPKIAVIPIDGVITTQAESTLYGTTSSSRDIANYLEQIKSDTSVKAVLLDINSPGGSPVASEEITNAIKELKLNIPVYVLVNDVGVSGAFWIAVSSDKVYASSMSTLGSIGVTSAGLGFEDFIAEYNISYRRQTAGKYKDMGTPFREPTQDEQEIIQNILDEIHKNFINHVAISRNMSYDEVEKYATGEIFLGSKAKELGFIDEIGYYPDVIADLKEKTGVEPLIVRYEREPTLAEVFGVDSIFNLPKAESQILLK